MDEHLASMTEEEREEVRKFLARFNEQVEMKVEQLLHESQAPRSEEDREMRTRLLSGEVPLIGEDGELYFKPRDALTLEDTARFGAFMDAERRRYEREIGDLGQKSEN